MGGSLAIEDPNYFDFADCEDFAGGGQWFVFPGPLRFPDFVLGGCNADFEIVNGDYGSGTDGAAFAGEGYQ